MKKLILIPALLLAALAIWVYHTSPEEEKAYYEALSNFTYIEDESDEYKVYRRIDKPFSGDCEDFAFTLQRQIGGEVWAVSRNGKVDHAALFVNEYVYDSLEVRPIAAKDYENNPIFKLTPPTQILKN